MEKLIIILLLLVISLTLVFLLIKVFRTARVNNIADLRLYSGWATQITVTDEYEGDVFFPYTGILKPDGGVVVPDARGRLWQRKWNQAVGVDPCWWGARGDGVTDCSDALDAMVNFCTILMGYGNPIENYWLPIMNFTRGGLYRLTRQWKIGGAPCSPEDAMFWDWNRKESPSYDLEEHKIISGQLPVTIKCNPRAFIFGDYKPKGNGLEAVISIGSDGWSYGGWDMQNPVIEGLKVAGRDSFDMYKHGRGSQQVGLIMYGGRNTHIRGCGFFNCEIGFIQNATYFDDLQQLQVRNCGKGYISQGCHSTNGFGWHGAACDTAFEIRSGAATFKGINTEECKRALVIGNGFCHFDGLYFEKSNTEPDDTENYQLQIGYKPGEDARGDSIVNCTTITAMTISGGINGILMNPFAQQLDIGGSVFVSTKVKTTVPTNRLIIRNCYGEAYQPQEGRIDYIY